LQLQELGSEIAEYSARERVKRCGRQMLEALEIVLAR
jgi:hypothetical protein